MTRNQQVALAKAIIKDIAAADPIGKVRKCGGACYKKTQAGWQKISTPSPKRGQYLDRAEDLISGMNFRDINKALNAVKHLIAKAKYEEGHVSHRRSGDYKKAGGAWVKVPANERQNQGAMEQSMGKPQDEGLALAPPPDPVGDKLGTRSLGSMATSGNEAIKQKNVDKIKQMVMSQGIDSTVSDIQAAFDEAGAGDLFDMNMPLDQMAELMARIDIDISGEYLEGAAGFGQDTVPQGEYPEATDEEMQDVFDPADGLGEETTGDDYGEEDDGGGAGAEEPAAEGHGGWRAGSQADQLARAIDENSDIAEAVAQVGQEILYDQGISEFSSRDAIRAALSDLESEDGSLTDALENLGFDPADFDGGESTRDPDGDTESDIQRRGTEEEMAAESNAEMEKNGASFSEFGALAQSYPSVKSWNDDKKAYFQQEFDKTGDLDAAYYATDEAYGYGDKLKQRKDLGSGAGAGTMPVSPLIPQGGRVRKSFNPLTGIWR